MLTLKECAGMSKLEVAEKVLGDLQQVDTTLPQMWLNYWSGTDNYETVRFGTVWSYKDGCLGVPAALTVESHNLIEERANNE